MAFLSVLVFTVVLAVTGAEACSGCRPDSGLVRLDFVNIGTESEETSHEAAGWGPIEPTNHRGTWGNIGGEKIGADCELPGGESCDAKTRVTWAGETYKEEQKPDDPYVTKTDFGCLPPAGTQPLFTYDPATPYEPDSFALLGRAARVVLDPNALDKAEAKSRQLRMRVLDGIGYDAFEVFVRNIKKVKEEGQIPAKNGGIQPFWYIDSTLMLQKT